MFRRSSALAREFVAVVRELAPDVEAQVVSADTVKLTRSGGGSVACSLDALARECAASSDAAGRAAKARHYTFNATLALSDRVWAAVESECGPAVCALPERELCLFVPAGDAAAVADLARLAPALFDAAGYPVSRGLYRRDGGTLAAVPD